MHPTLNPKRESREQDFYDKKTVAVTMKKQVAVCVGIDHYKPGIKNLKNAVNDAAAIGDVLVREFGFSLYPNASLLDEVHATLPAIQAGVSNTLATADEETRWLFYFSGHGAVVDGQGYLLPVDAEPEDQVQTYLPLPWILDQCRNSRCGEALIILDSCYSGRALVKPDILDSPIDPERDDNRFCQLLSSGNPDQPVLDEGGGQHSIFTYALLEILQGWTGVHDPNHCLRFSRILDYLVFDIPGRLSDLGLPTYSQSPMGGYIYRGRSGQMDFVFEPKLPRLAPALLNGLRDIDPRRRTMELDNLEGAIQNTPELRSLSISLAQAHLRKESKWEYPYWVTGFLRHEPVAEVRAAAARVLGQISTTANDDAITALQEALQDDPAVTRSAAQALGALDVKQVSATICDCLEKSDNDLFLDLAKVIGQLAEPEHVLRMLRLGAKRDLIVPFIGTDLPADLTGIPDRTALARLLASQEGFPQPGSLSEVINQTISGPRRRVEKCPQCGTIIEGAGNRYIAYQFLKQIFSSAHKVGPFYESLARIPANVWISTAFDDNLAAALKAKEVLTGNDFYENNQLPGTNRVVVRLAGNLHNPDSLAVLPIDFKVKLDRDLSFTHSLRTCMHKRLLVFMGFNPLDPDLHMLLDALFLHREMWGLDVVAFLVWSSATGELRRHAGIPMFGIDLTPERFLDALIG